MERAELLGTVQKQLNKAPSLLPNYLLCYWTAFSTLSKRRMSGFGACPISLTEIETYCRVKNLTHLIDEYVYLISAMDDEWLKQVNKKNDS